MDTVETITFIQNNPTYKKVLVDSFGGVVYNIANQGTYDSTEILDAWNKLSEGAQNVAGGIMSGAMNFLSGK